MLALRTPYVRSPRGGSSVWAEPSPARTVLLNEFFGPSGAPVIAPGVGRSVSRATATAVGSSGGGGGVIVPGVGRSAGRAAGAAIGRTVERGLARSASRASGRASLRTINPAVARALSIAYGRAAGADANTATIVPGVGRSIARTAGGAVGTARAPGIGRSVSAAREVAAARAIATGTGTGLAQGAARGRAAALQGAAGRSVARSPSGGGAAALEAAAGRAAASARGVAEGSNGDPVLVARRGVSVGRSVAVAVGRDANITVEYRVGGPTTIDLFPSERVATPDRVFRRTK